LYTAKERSESMNLEKLFAVGALVGAAMACGYALAWLERNGRTAVRQALPPARRPHPYYLQPCLN
jgi:hypothetical protein